jgi:hypothetical protein
MFRRTLAVGAFALACGLAISAHADSVTFSNFVDQSGNSNGTDWIDFYVNVSDQSPGKFVITVGHNAGSPNLGDITGVFFDAYEGLTPSNANITSIIGAIASVDDDTNKLPGGVQVSPIPEFDLGIQYYGMTRQVGGTTVRDDLQTVSFSMSNLGFLTLADFSRFGIRAQSVAPNGVDRLTYNLQGSTKEFSTNGGNVVPLPAAAWGGLALMATLGAVRLRRRSCLL